MGTLRDRLRGWTPGPTAIRPASPPLTPSTDKPDARIKALTTPQVPKSLKNLADPEFLALKSRVQTALLARIDNPEQLPADELKQAINDIVTQDTQIPLRDRETVVSQLTDELLGYGPLQALIDDPTISEIMVNGPNDIYIEERGELVKLPLQFRDGHHLRHVLEKMLLFSGRQVDEAHPMVDARLPDGSRLNAILAPVSVGGDTITIRKFAREAWNLDDLAHRGTLSLAMAQFLQAAVRARLNIVVAGGTGSGKTTTLNALSAYIGPKERIVTIEDAAELQLQQAHKVRLEARPPNTEGRGAVTIRDLVRNALRMRPDRIIVGEVRGGEALDMLQAMNTGHEGSMTTVHANSARDALARIETMVLMAGAELPLPAIRSQITSAVHLIVYQSRLLDGSRRITGITEVAGMESGLIATQDLFVFEQQGLDPHGNVLGHFRATGVRTRHWDWFLAQGVPVLPEWFDSHRED